MPYKPVTAIREIRKRGLIARTSREILRDLIGEAEKVRICVELTGP